MKIGQYKQMKAYLTRPKRIFPTDTSKKISTVKKTKTFIAPANIKIDPISFILSLLSACELEANLSKKIRYELITLTSGQWATLILCHQYII